MARKISDRLAGAGARPGVRNADENADVRECDDRRRWPGPGCPAKDPNTKAAGPRPGGMQVAIAERPGEDDARKKEMM